MVLSTRLCPVLMRCCCSVNSNTRFVMSGLTIASEISGVISGVVVICGAGAACWKCNSIVRMMIRIAERRERPGELEMAEEGLANHPALQDTARLAERALRTARMPQAAAQIGMIESHARQRGVTRPQSSENAITTQPPSQQQMQATSVQAQPSRARPRPGFVREDSFGPVERVSHAVEMRSRDQSPGMRARRGLSSIKGGHTGGRRRGFDGR
jgi:hypothetical protein